MNPLLVTLIGAIGPGAVIVAWINSRYQLRAAKSKESIDERNAVLTAYSAVAKDQLALVQALREEVASLRARLDKLAAENEKLQAHNRSLIDHIYKSKGPPPPPPPSPHDR